MFSKRLVFLTALALVAFAGNSLLCRIALKETAIDAASFTSIRLISGALILWLIVHLKDKGPTVNGSWPSAFALFVYAAGFSFAYINLPAATGALLLFGAVQITMIGYGIYSGEKLKTQQLGGFLLALAGLIGLLLPGLSAPPLKAALLMLIAGIAWGVYSLRGKTAGDPTQATGGNFLKTIPMTLLLSLIMFQQQSIDVSGTIYAVVSGALASGLGYAIWYSVLPHLKSAHAATLQLSVPVIAAFGGIILLSEPLSLRLFIASLAILGGIAVFIWEKERY